MGGDLDAPQLLAGARGLRLVGLHRVVSQPVQRTPPGAPGTPSRGQRARAAATASCWRKIRYARIPYRMPSEPDASMRPASAPRDRGGSS